MCNGNKQRERGIKIMAALMENRVIALMRGINQILKRKTFFLNVTLICIHGTTHTDTHTHTQTGERRASQSEDWYKAPSALQPLRAALLH